jgi:hypothetical protein
VRETAARRDVRDGHALRELDCITERSLNMLWTLAIVLLVLWLLGMLTSYTLGGVIHVLLVVALVMVVIRLIQGRRLT